MSADRIVGLDLPRISAPHLVGPIHVGSREIVRRLFVTVRDSNWREVAPRSAEVDRSDPYHLKYRAGYASPLIDFEWTGSLVLDSEERLITFEIEGEVRRDGEICRLGLTVLLPPDIVACANGVIANDEGETAVTFAEGMGGQPIVDGWPTGLTAPFHSIEIKARDGAHLSLGFEGELFEIEDQRNWGDASFKIYCTPLARGFPREVNAGERVRHRVEIRYQVPDKRKAIGASLLSPRLFPEVGSSPAHSDLPTTFVAAGPDDAATLGPGKPVELHVTSDALADPARLRTTIAAMDGSICRVLLTGEEGRPPAPATLHAMKALLANLGIAVPVLASVRGYFVEYNRGDADLDGADGMAWPLSPSVHASDLETIFENAAPFAPMAAHARTHCGEGHLAAAPLAWSYPAQTPIDAAPAYVLAWFVSAMIDAATAGIASVTLGDDLAAHLQGDAECDAVFRKVIDLGGIRIQPVATEVEGLAAMLLGADDARELLLVNLTARPRHFLAPSGAGDSLEIPPRSLMFRPAEGALSA